MSLTHCVEWSGNLAAVGPAVIQRDAGMRFFREVAAGRVSTHASKVTLSSP